MMPILTIPVLDSTNTYAKEHLHELADGQIVRAIRQTGGRGQRGRTWLSDEDRGLYMTWVLKPAEETVELLSTVPLFTAEVVCRVLEGFGIMPTVKWPNDVLVNGRKIAGILTESVIRGGRRHGLVLGLGLNVNSGVDVFDALDQPATSMAVELGYPVDIEVVLKKIAAQFKREYPVFIEKTQRS